MANVAVGFSLSIYIVRIYPSIFTLPAISTILQIFIVILPSSFLLYLDVSIVNGFSEHFSDSDKLLTLKSSIFVSLTYTSYDLITDEEGSSMLLLSHILNSLS